MTEPQFFSMRTSRTSSNVQVHLRLFGEDGALLALSESELSRPYAPTYEWIPKRLPHDGETIICHAWFENARKRWTDVLTSGSFLVISRRVFDILTSERIESFTVVPLIPHPRRSGLPKGMDMPDYIAIRLAPGMEIEWEYSAVTPKRGSLLVGMNRRWKRWVPIESTWQGFDLFGGGVCTRRFIDLAREYQWTNFEFKPLDVRRDMPSEGIDYLGKQWPPKRWYPPSPSDGRTVTQWVDAFMEQTRQASELARTPGADTTSTRQSDRVKERALQAPSCPRSAILYDLAADAVPLFVDIARTGDEADQNIAAQMLVTMAQHTPIDTDILKDVVLPICQRAMKQGGTGTGFGHTTIALNSYVEVPREMLDRAHGATGKPPMLMPADWE